MEKEEGMDFAHLYCITGSNIWTHEMHHLVYRYKEQHLQEEVLLMNLSTEEQWVT